nr:MAG TPA: minor tail protein [Caudoviricetes sp.]
MELFKLFGTIAIHNDEANQAIDDTVGKAKDSESSLSSTFKKVGTAVAAAFSAQKIIDFGVQSVNTLQGFEDSMLKVQSLSGATADQYQQLSDAALHYGSTTAWTSQNVADAMGYMALAGFDTNEILSATPGVLSLASASGEDLATVSDILTDAMTGFGDSASDATRYADVLATTQAKSNTTVGMLGEAFTYVSSLAGTYSYSLEDVSTALGVMANAGVKGSMAGTSLSSVITRLGTNTSGARDAIEALGVQFYNTDGTARPLGDVIVDLCDATANMTTEQKASLASTVAGAEAQKGLLAILNQGSSAYTDLNQKLKESSGNADEMAGTLESGLGGAIRSLSSAWEGFKIKLAQKFEVPLSDLIHKFANFITNSAIPALDNFVSAITPVVTALGNFGKWMREGSAGAELLKAVIIAVTTAFVAWQTVAAAQSMWSKLKKGIEGARIAFTALGKAMSANWMGLVAVAIIGIVTAIIYLWNNCEWFRDGVTAIWEAIKTAFTTAFEVISTGIQNFITSVEDFIANLKQGIQDKLDEIHQGWDDAWNAIQTTAQTVFDGISQTVSNFVAGVQGFFQSLYEGAQAAWDTICNVVQVAILFVQELLNAAVEILMIPWNFIWTNFGEAITSAWEGFKQIISNALDTISSTIQNIWNAIVAFLTPILQGIADTFTSIWNSILTAVQTATNTISNVLQTVWNAIVGFLTPILQGIRDTFTNSWNAIQNTVKTVVTAIQTFLQTTWNTITSLIRTAMNTIHNVIQTVWNTIKSVVQSVLNTIQSIVSSVWNTVKSVTTSVWNGISSAVSNAINTVKNVISGGLNAAHNTVSNIFNSIRNTISNIMNGAANVVSGAINRIKEFFNFSWSLPHLAMPHPYISGSFSLNPPSVPSFGINWYAKGGILTEPTLFSLNPKTGRASVGGEAGDEAVAPIDTLLTYIRTAVGEQNGDLAGKLDALIELLQQYFSSMLDNMQRGIVLDSGVLVGELAPAMDEALGEIYYRKGRE